jgi:hypothetical protein
MTNAQRAMLKMAVRNPDIELSTLVMECACAYTTKLAWRIADRTASALIRRAYIKMDGDIVHVTVLGQLALEHF